MRYVFTREDQVQGGQSLPLAIHVKAGKRSHELKRGAHAFTSEELAAAGRKGGLAHKGKSKSPAHRAKISANMKAIWEQRKRSRKAETGRS